MKIQIVYLNPEDDIHSALDMLSWVKAPRALLVWPDRGKVLSAQLDLVLLQRFTRHRKIEIGLLTFDSEIRNLAIELGIPVFDSIDELPEESWNSAVEEISHYPEEKEIERGELDPPEYAPSSWRWFEDLSKTKKIALSSGFVILGILFFLLFIPSATVTISPARIARLMEFEIIPTTTDYREVGSQSLLLKPEFVQVSGTLTEETSGKTLAPISQAEGTVIFSNLSSKQITIPSNTIVRTSAEGGIRYRTTKSANLPDEIGAEVEVPIEAMTAGRIGNVSPNSIIYIEGALGLYLTVTNPNTLKGGSDEIHRMVTHEDLDRIEENLMEELIHQAEMELNESISSDQIDVKGTIEIGEIYERNSNHFEGDLADSVTMEMVVEFIASSLNKPDLGYIASERLADELPPGYKIRQNSLSIESAELFMQEGSKEQCVLVTAKLETYRSFDPKTIKSVIRGQRPSIAFSLLFKTLDLAFIPKIEIRPDWIPILPLLSERIEVRGDVE